ncbi:TIGR03936 family radical SAM-associated protein [Candidatus Omnitrophota bacterium]
MEERIQYALTFSKKGILKYISHLDLVNMFDRALRRTKVPVYYSKGYNPKIKMSFIGARKLGEEIETDVFRIYLLEEILPNTLKNYLNNELPEEIRISDITKEETTSTDKKRP